MMTLVSFRLLQVVKICATCENFWANRSRPPPPGKKLPVHNAYGHVGEYPIMFSSFFIISSHVSYSPINSKVQQPTPRAFQLLKIGSFKCSSLSSTLSVKCPLQEESSAPVVSNEACAYTCQHMFRDRLYDYGSFTVT